MLVKDIRRENALFSPEKVAVTKLYIGSLAEKESSLRCFSIQVIEYASREAFEWGSMNKVKKKENNSRRWKKDCNLM